MWRHVGREGLKSTVVCDEVFGALMYAGVPQGRSGLCEIPFVGFSSLPPWFLFYDAYGNASIDATLVNTTVAPR